MIGIFGIAYNCKSVSPGQVVKSCSAMHDNLNNDLFKAKQISANNFSMGIIIRSNGKNKDLAVRKIGKDSVVAFCGYGKLRGEQRLCWAEEMLDRIGRWQNYGDNAWKLKIEGSFVCIIYDKNKIVIISDRFASKELYYYENQDVLVFGSNVDSLIDSGLIPRQKNIDAAIQLFSSHFFIGNNTLVENVFSFPFASIYIRNFKSKGYGEFNRYWDIPQCDNDNQVISSEMINELAEKMHQAIFELLALEPNAYTGLSGGLDSRAIACFLSKEIKVKTITYGAEMTLAKKVGKVLGTDMTFLKDKYFRQHKFQDLLQLEIENSRCHSVLNQYFITPLFRFLSQDHQGFDGLFDGIYMDILFSAPYVYPLFDLNQFAKTYFSGSTILDKYSKVSMEDYNRVKENTFENITAEAGNNSPQSSESCYLRGRLMRYVSASPKSRENYFYILKPGFNYDLVDFAHKLSLPIRKGHLYVEMLKQKFPEAMKVPYKDSYGNKKKTAAERIASSYSRFRNRLSSVTCGKISYVKNEADIFFLRQGGLASYKSHFFEDNFVDELFSNEQLQHLYSRTFDKYYLFPFFQQILFLQSFYKRNSFGTES